MTEFTIVSNVWESCSASPEEAMVNKLKAQMVIVIREMIVANGWNQPTAARYLDLTQPRISNLINGQISKFSIDNLYKIITKLGYMIDFKMSEGKPSGAVECIEPEAA